MKEYVINLSTDNYEMLKTDINIKQNDFNSARFLISTPSLFTSALLKFKLQSSSVIVSDNYTVSEGMLSYLIENSVISEFGTVICEVSFYDEDSRITTNTFSFNVTEEIDASSPIEADNKLPVLDNLILRYEELTKANEKLFMRCEELTKTAQSLNDNQPYATSNGRYAFIKDCTGVKKHIKIYGNENNSASKLICSDGNNMLKFLSIYKSVSYTSKDYLSVKENKIYINNLNAAEITSDKDNFYAYFNIEPITLYKNVPYTITNDNSSLYPYVILLDENLTQIKNNSGTKVFIPEEDVTVHYIRLWYNFSVSSMSNFTYNGFLNIGIYAGEYTSRSQLPVNTLENRFQIEIGQMSKDSYLLADNVNAFIYENGVLSDITDTTLGRALINFSPYKNTCCIYNTEDSQIEISYYEDIMSVLERYVLKAETETADTLSL